MQVRFTGENDLAWLQILRDRDGAPMAEKRGCANYRMDPRRCDNSYAYMGHFHDFDGTIGFRCAADPLPRRRGG